MLPNEALVQIASRLPLHSLAMLASACREYRFLLRSPAVWSLRCRDRLLEFSSVLYLDEKRILAQVRTLKVMFSMPRPLERRKLFIPLLENVDLGVRPSRDELLSVFNAVPRKNLKRLLLPLSCNVLPRLLKGDAFPSLTELELHLCTPFAVHAHLVNSQCPNLHRLVIREMGASVVLQQVAAPSFDNLTSLVYGGGGNAAAKCFRHAAKIVSLDLRECRSLRGWTAIEAEIERLWFPYSVDIDNGEVTRTLARWRKTLNSVFLPTRFADLLVYIAGQFKICLKQVLFYDGLNDEQMREQLMESCPSLESIK